MRQSLVSRLHVTGRRVRLSYSPASTASWCSQLWRPSIQARAERYLYPMTVSSAPNSCHKRLAVLAHVAATDANNLIMKAATFFGLPSVGGVYTSTKPCPRQAALAADSRDAAANPAGLGEAYGTFTEPAPQATLPHWARPARLHGRSAHGGCKGSVVMLTARRRTCRRCIWLLVNPRMGVSTRDVFSTPSKSRDNPGSTRIQKAALDWLNSQRTVTRGPRD